MATKKLSDSQKIAAIIEVLKDNGLSLPASLDPPKAKEKAGEEAKEE